MSQHEMTMDLDTVLDMVETPVAPEIKARQAATPAPAGAPGDAGQMLATLTAAIDRQTEALEAKQRGVREARATASPAPVRTPAEAQARIQKARALVELRQTSERHAAPTARGGGDPLDRQKMARINADMDRHDDEELVRLRRENADLRRKAARPAGPVDPTITPAAKGTALAFYRKCVTQYMRTGQEVFGGRHLKELQDACIKLDAKAFNASVGPEGGFFVQPERDSGPLEALLLKYSPMRQLASVRTISSASFKKNVNLRGSTTRWVGETTATSEDTTPQFAELEFPAMTLLAEPRVTAEALEDASIDVEELLAEEGFADFAEAEGAAFIAGNGDKKPRGILSYTFVADASWTWGSGNVGYLITGVDGGFHATTPADVLRRLPLQLKKMYRQNAAWLMNRSTIGVARTIKASDGHYLWSEGDLSKAIPATLEGYVVEEDEQMPDIATNAHSIAFGDWKAAYQIVDRIGFQVFRNPYLAPPYVIFHMRKRVGGGIKNFQALKTIRFSAS